jgi:hypothetical protein
MRAVMQCDAHAETVNKTGGLETGTAVGDGDVGAEI